MANHQSSIKRIRQDQNKKVHQRYYAKTTRNLIQRLRETTVKKEAKEILPNAFSMLDKLVKKHQIHKNKAANLKSSLTKHVASLK